MNSPRLITAIAIAACSSVVYKAHADSEVNIRIVISASVKEGSPVITYLTPLDNASIEAHRNTLRPNEWLARVPVSSEALITYIQVSSEPLPTDNYPVVVIAPAAVHIGESEIHFGPPGTTPMELNERSIRKHIWQAIDPRESTSPAELFEGLVLTNSALKWFSTQREGTISEARVALVHAKIVAILRQEHWIELGTDYDLARERAIDSLRRASRSDSHLESLMLPSGNEGRAQLETRIAQLERGDASILQRIYSGIVSQQCDESKIETLSSLSRPMASIYRPKTAIGLAHPHTVIADLAQCSVKLATCENMQKDDAIALLERAMQQVLTMKQRNLPENGVPPNLQLQATETNVRVKLEGVRNGQIICT